MSDPYTSEIRMVGFTFAPRNWANCDGTILLISSNVALFSLIGATFGGDGRTNFGLPSMGGRAAMQFGQGPRLRNRVWGEAGGAAFVILNQTMMPSHAHPLAGNPDVTGKTDPVGNAFGKISVGGPAAKKAYASGQTPNVALASASIGTAGVGQSHQNMQPFQVVRFIICLNGVYPTRN